MTRQAYWNNFLKQFSPFLNTIILIGSLANLGAGLVLYFFEKTNHLFAGIDIAIGLLLLMMFLVRYRFSNYLKVSVLATIILFHAIMSFLGSGLIGTGILALLLLQVVALVFLPLMPALMLGSISLITIAVFILLIHTGHITYGFSLIIRMNSPAHWITILISTVLFFILTGGTITLLKRRLIENIEKLEDSNKFLTNTNRELQENRQKLEHLAYYDPLTGLLNRERFKELVNQRVSAAAPSDKELDKETTQGFLILVNIKNFRIINSIFGSKMGDRVLRTIGELLSGYQSENNFIARLHGDEFAGWANGWSEDDLESRMTKFRQDLKQRLPAELKDLHMDFYIAAAAYPQDGHNFEECFRKAGAALKIAKETGSTRVRHFQHSMIQKAELEMRMRRLLEIAIEARDFTVCYQKKIDIHTGEITGVEALARWHSNELGDISPGVFVPVIRKSQLMIPFTQAIIDIIFSEIAALHKKLGSPVPVSINTSPLFFLKPGFTEYITEKIEQAGISPQLITLEITEDVFIEDISRIRDIIAALNRHGINIALDDFGKGFSSIYYISHIHFNELKVDKSFIDEIVADPKRFGVFSSICDFAATLGYKTVAEGVETEEQVEKIKQTRCRVVQGYFFSRPEPL